MNPRTVTTEPPKLNRIHGSRFGNFPGVETQRSEVTPFPFSLFIILFFFFATCTGSNALTPARVCTRVQQLCGAAAPAVLHRCCFKLQRPVRPHSQKRLTHAENYHRPSRTIHTQTHTFAGLCLPFTRFPSLLTLIQVEGSPSVLSRWH